MVSKILMKSFSWFCHVFILVFTLTACGSTRPNPLPTQEIKPLSPAIPSTTIPPVPTSTRTPKITDTINPMISTFHTPTNAFGEVHQPSLTPDQELRLRTFSSNLPLKYIMTNKTGREILLLDTSGNLVSQISFTELTPLDTVWSNDLCQLLVTTTNGQEIQLLGISLDGQVVASYFKGGYDSTRRWLTFPSFSSNAAWIAYAVWSGEFGYQNESYQDIEVISRDNPSNPMQLTDHGGAWEKGGVWSPDGDRLAFTDYDNNHILQILTSAPNGEQKKQLSNFTQLGMKPGPLNWSSDGRAIASVIYSANNGRSPELQLWIFSDGGNTKRTNLPDGDSITVNSL
jgi:Tol biopolymer transport system component